MAFMSFMVKYSHHEEPEVIEDLHTKLYRRFSHYHHEILPVCSPNIYLLESNFAFFANFAVVKKERRAKRDLCGLSVFA